MIAASQLLFYVFPRAFLASLFLPILSSAASGLPSLFSFPVRPGLILLPHLMFVLDCLRTLFYPSQGVFPRCRLEAFARDAVTFFNLGDWILFVGLKLLFSSFLCSLYGLIALLSTPL